MNRRTSPWELALVAVVLLGSVAFVVDAPMDIAVPTRRGTTPVFPGHDTHAALHPQRRVARLEERLLRKQQILDRRRTQAAAAEYQVLRCEAALRPLEIRLLDAMEQPVGSMHQAADRHTAVEAAKQRVVAASRNLNRAKYSLRSIQRSIADRSRRLARLTECLHEARLALANDLAPDEPGRSL